MDCQVCLHMSSGEKLLTKEMKAKEATNLIGEIIRSKGKFFDLTKYHQEEHVWYINMDNIIQITANAKKETGKPEIKSYGGI